MAHIGTTPRRPSWWKRLGEYCYRASTPQLVRDMQHASSGAFDALVKDLEAPLEAGFEREVARQLNQGAYLAFVPTETLMPVMMQRFGLGPEALAKDPAIHALRTTCNACSKVGTCWLALRHRASRAECRDFCPNAEAFERRASAAGSGESG